MTERERRPHLLVRDPPRRVDYTYPLPVRGKGLALPARDRAAHGEHLSTQLAELGKRVPDLQRARRAEGVREGGVYLEVFSDPGFELYLKGLDRHDRGKQQRHIELVSVREVDTAMAATVYVPDGKLGEFEKLISEYLTKESSKSGEPRNRTLIESIANLRLATLHSFWTDDPREFPTADTPIEWEVWLRGAPRIKKSSQGSRNTRRLME